jgi:TonB-dependent receptor
MSNKSRFTYGRKTLLGLSVATMALASSVAIAQEAADATDEVVVTGIRKALENSVELKRNAKGIVDSISAEDMGKFPDSNLAESLQRVTGVSIDRDQTSGEGKTITVRGFGSDYNLVTLNGRMMPTSTLGNFAAAPSTRSYDFGNLAPEAVSRVDIYKTSKASVASGGMGSTIDIRTTRPLDIPGFAATVGLKSVDDDSTDGAPHNEISALISNTWMDGKVGLSLTAVQQSMEHTVASYRHTWSGFEAYGDLSTNANNESDDIVNGVSATALEDPLFGYGETLISTINGGAGYYIDDLEQDRRNLQLTFQARPADNLTLTLDATNSRLEHEVRSRDSTVYIVEATGGTGWKPFYPYSSSVYGDGNPASIESLTFDAQDIFGHNSTMGYQNNITEVDTLGFNAEWDVNERLSLEFDIHSSESESKPLSDYGSMGYITSTSKVMNTVNIDYTSELPTISMGGANGALANLYLDGQAYAGVLGSPEDPQFLWHRYLTGAANVNAYNHNEIEQAQINGSYDLAGTDFEAFADVIKFGVSSTENNVYAAIHEQSAPNYDGVLSPNFDAWPYYGSDFGPSIYPTESLQPYFSGLQGSDAIFPSIINARYEDWFTAYQTYGALQMSKHNANSAAYKPSLICGDNTVAGCKDFDYTTQRYLEEETISFYVQASKEFELNTMPASVVVGLRYEDTDVTSRNFIPTYSSTQVSGSDQVVAIATGGSEFFTTTGSYDYLLPSFDFDIEVRDDVKLRASYSQTIARHTYDKLAGGVAINVNIPNLKQVPNGFTGGGAEGNPNLKPFEADNYDVSAEWYYGDSSYLSVGYFAKETSNWVGSANKQVNVQGLTHAAYDLVGAPSGLANGELSTSDNELVVFNVAYSAPSDRTETIDGIELTIQHDFADYNPLPFDMTGFGVIANATFVESDADYDNTVANSDEDSQFAIVGISDSYNLIAYYERFGISARVAYNWRDRFLNFSGASSGYVEEYEQVDMNVSYTIPNSSLTLSYDGINLNEEGRETFERNNPAYKTWISPGHAKHYLGVRWKY